MRHIPLGHSLQRLSSGGHSETLLGLIVIATSSALPAFTVNNALAQLIALATIPLLRLRAPAALIPLGVITVLWVSGFSDHLLFSGFLVYLAIECAATAGRRIIAFILAGQWLILAYGITVPGLPTAADSPAFLMEGLFILLAVAVGQFRWKNTRERQHSERARENLEQELRSGLARYLHDSVARSLTMMSMQATATEMATTDPETRRRLRGIAKTGRGAITDLHQLVDHLIDTNPRDSATMLGLWHTASIGETIDSAAQLLDEAGYQVTATGIDPAQRLPRTTETAFALVFNEATANLVKHSPQGGPVSITAHQRDRHIDVEVRNTREHKVLKDASMPDRTRVGLTSMSTRMREIGGHAEITTTPESWQVTLSLPLTHD